MQMRLGIRLSKLMTASLIKKIFHRDVASAIYGIEHNHHRSRIVARRLIDRVRNPLMAA